MSRNEIPRKEMRPDPTFTQKPTGHSIPSIGGFGPSADDKNMSFNVPDCGVKAGGQFSDPFFMDDCDLPTPPKDIRNRHGF